MVELVEPTQEQNAKDSDNTASIRHAQLPYLQTNYTLESIRNLSPSDFECFIAELFRSIGCDATVTPHERDNGIDIILSYNGSTGYVQCKKYITSQVGVDEVRSFYGAIVDRLGDGKAYFVTTNVFTHDAREFIASCKYADQIKLVDAKLLMHKVMLLDNQYRRIKFTPSPDTTQLPHDCPRCHGGHLVQRYSKKRDSHFVGCSNYPTCRYVANVKLIQDVI